MNEMWSEIRNLNLQSVLLTIHTNTKEQRIGTFLQTRGLCMGGNTTHTCTHDSNNLQISTEDHKLYSRTSCLCKYDMWLKLAKTCANL